MLNKETVIDKIEVTENGTVQVRQSTRIVEDGNVISQSYHRWTISPGEDYSDQEERVQNICQVTHTEDVVNKFKTTTTSNQNLG